MAVTLLSSCPRCGWSSHVHKSRFHGLDVLLPLLLLRPVRCHDCGRRYYRPLFFRTLARSKPMPPFEDAQKPGAHRAA